MPIYMAPRDQEMVIIKITGNDKQKTRLQTMGFVEGETITVVHCMDENVIVKIKGVSVAIGKDLAKRILV